MILSKVAVEIVGFALPVFLKLSLSWGSGGPCKPPVGPGQSLGGGPGGKAPEAPRILTFSTLKYLKNSILNCLLTWKLRLNT